MVEIIYYIAASLDGYIAPLDRGLSWLAPFESSAEDYGYADFYRSIDAVLVGSQTFQQASQFPQWPYPEKLCWVFSRQTLRISLPHVFVTDQSPWEVVVELGRRGWSARGLLSRSGSYHGVHHFRDPRIAGGGRAAIRLTSPSRAFAPRRIQGVSSGTRATALPARLQRWDVVPQVTAPRTPPDSSARRPLACGLRRGERSASP